jgi:hypothetical protein
MSYAAEKLPGRTYCLSNGTVSEISFVYQVLTPRLAKAPGLDDLTGFPAIGSAPSGDDIADLPLVFDLRMLDVDVTEHESGIKWEFTATYKKPGAGPDEDESGEDPTEFPTRITHGTKIISVESPWDVNGKPFLNSAGMPYERPIPIRVPVRVVTVEKKLRTKVNISGVSGTCNAAEVNIDGDVFAASTAIIDATCESTGNVDWPWQLRYTIEELYQLDDQGANTGHLVNVVNTGYSYIEEGTGKVVLAMIEGEDGKLKQAPAPVKLDDTGHLLTEGQPLTSIQYATARESVWPAWVTVIWVA